MDFEKQPDAWKICLELMELTFARVFGDIV